MKNPWEMDALTFANSTMAGRAAGETEEDKRQRMIEEAKAAAKELRKQSSAAGLEEVTSQYRPKSVYNPATGQVEEAKYKTSAGGKKLNDWVDLSQELRNKGFERSIADTAAVAEMPSSMPSRAELEASEQTFSEEEAQLAESRLTMNPLLLGASLGMEGSRKPMAAVMKVGGMVLPGKAGELYSERAKGIEESAGQQLIKKGYRTASDYAGELTTEALIGSAGGAAIGAGAKAASAGRWGNGVLANVAEGIVQESIDTSLRTAAGAQGYEWSDLPTNIALSALFDTTIGTGLKLAAKAVTKSDVDGFAAMKAQDPEKFAAMEAELSKASEQARVDNDVATLEWRKKFEEAKRLAKQYREVYEKTGADFSLIATAGNRGAKFDPAEAPAKDAPIESIVEYSKSLPKKERALYKKTLGAETAGEVDRRIFEDTVDARVMDGTIGHSKGLADDAEVKRMKAEALEMYGKPSRIDYDVNTGDKLYYYDNVKKHIPARDMDEYGIHIDETDVPQSTYFNFKAKDWMTSVYFDKLATDIGAPRTSFLPSDALHPVTELRNAANFERFHAGDSGVETGMMKANDDFTEWAKDEMMNGRGLTRDKVTAKIAELTEGKQRLTPSQIKERMPLDTDNPAAAFFGTKKDKAAAIEKSKESIDHQRALNARKTVQSGEYEPEKALAEWSDKFEAAGISPLITSGNAKKDVVAMFRKLEDATVPAVRDRNKWRLNRAVEDISNRQPLTQKAKAAIVQDGAAIIKKVEAEGQAAVRKAEELAAVEKSPLFAPEAPKKTNAKADVAKERLVQNLKRKFQVDDLRALVRQTRQAARDAAANAKRAWKDAIETKGGFFTSAQNSKRVYADNTKINLYQLQDYISAKEYAALKRYAAMKSPDSPEAIEEAMGKVVSYGVDVAQRRWIGKAEDAISDATKSQLPRSADAAKQSLLDAVASYKATGNLNGLKSSVEDIEGFVRAEKEKAGDWKLVQNERVNGAVADTAGTIKSKAGGPFYRRAAAKVGEWWNSFLVLDRQLNKELEGSEAARNIVVGSTAINSVKYRNFADSAEKKWVEASKGLDDYDKTDVGIAAHMYANPEDVVRIIENNGVRMDGKNGRLISGRGVRTDLSNNPRYDGVVKLSDVEAAKARVMGDPKLKKAYDALLEVHNDKAVFEKASDALMNITGIRMGKRDKYLPLISESRPTEMADKLEASMGIDSMGRSMDEFSESMRRGFTNQRVEGASTDFMVNPDDIVNHYLDNNARYAFLAEDAWRVARYADGLSKAGVKNDHPIRLYLSEKVKRLTRGTSEPRDMKTKAFDTADSVLTVLSLGYNAMTSAIQTTGLVQGAMKRGASSVNIINSAKASLGGAFQEAMEASPHLRSAFGAGESVQASRIASGVGLGGWARKKYLKTSDFLMQSLTAIDSRARAAVWMEAYARHAKKNGIEWKHGDAIDKLDERSIDAIAKADNDTRTAMGTSEKDYRPRMFDSKLARAAFFLGKSQIIYQREFIENIAESTKGAYKAVKGGEFHKALAEAGEAARGIGMYVLAASLVAGIRNLVSQGRSAVGGGSATDDKRVEEIAKAAEKGALEVMKYVMLTGMKEQHTLGLLPSEYGGRELGIGGLVSQVGKGGKEGLKALTSDFDTSLATKIKEAVLLTMSTAVPGDMKTILRALTTGLKERNELEKSLKESGVDVTKMTAKDAMKEVERKKKSAEEKSESKSSFGKFLESRAAAGEWYSDDNEPYKELYSWLQSEADRTGKDIGEDEVKSYQKKFVNYANQYKNEDAIVSRLTPAGALDYLVGKYGKDPEVLDSHVKELNSIGLLTDKDYEDMVEEFGKMDLE